MLNVMDGADAIRPIRRSARSSPSALNACSSRFGLARTFEVGLALVTGGQELIVQLINLARLVQREFVPPSQVTSGGLVFDPILNRPLALMNRSILGDASLRKK
jgi:hypothetical protein